MVSKQKGGETATAVLILEGSRYAAVLETQGSSTRVGVYRSRWPRWEMLSIEMDKEKSTATYTSSMMGNLTIQVDGNTMAGLTGPPGAIQQGSLLKMLTYLEAAMRERDAKDGSKMFVQPPFHYSTPVAPSMIIVSWARDLDNLGVVLADLMRPPVKPRA